MKVTFKALCSLFASVVLIGAAPTTYTNVVSAGLPTFNLTYYGAKCDGVTPDDAAWNALLADPAAANGGTILVPRTGHLCLMLNSLTFPLTGTSPPTQPPFRVTADGPTWDPFWGFLPNTPKQGAGFDLRYTGADGLHPAKLDTRGAGALEIDHLTLVSGGTDNFLMCQSTNTMLYVHDNMIIGNAANSGTSNRQDFCRLGGAGYWATNVSTTNGSTTLTVGAGDPPFTAAMVGYAINYKTAANAIFNFGSAIASYVSPTQVTLADPATATIVGGVANYYGAYGSAGPQAAFSGYNSRFVHNLYSHIRRVLVFENTVNGTIVEDEAFSLTTGCSNADVPNCAPYYFERASTTRSSNVFRGVNLEITYYPFEVSFQYGAVSNQVVFAHGGDGSTPNNVGGVWIGDTTSTNNTVMPGTFQPYRNAATTNTTVPAPIAAGSQTVTPASMAGISLGNQYLVDPDCPTQNGCQEWVTPSAVTATTFTAPFAFAHNAGARVLSGTPYVAGPGYAVGNTLLGNGQNTIEGTLLPHPVTLGQGGAGITTTKILGPLLLPNLATDSHAAIPAISDGKTAATTLGYTYPIVVGNLGTAATFGAFANNSGSTTAAGATALIGGGGTLYGHALSCWQFSQITASVLIGGDCAGNTFVPGVSVSNGVQPNGTTGGYAPEFFPGGSPSGHPRVVSGTGTASSTGTVISLPITFSNSTYTCHLTPQADTTTSGQPWYTPADNTTSSIKAWTHAGSIPVAYWCGGAA